MKDLKMIFFLLVLFSLCSLLLTGAQTAYDKASTVINRRLYGTILELYEIGYEEETVEETFIENFEIQEVGKSVFYISKEVQKGSVAFKTKGPGLWNLIEVLLVGRPRGRVPPGIEDYIPGGNTGAGRVESLNYPFRRVLMG